MKKLLLFILSLIIIGNATLQRISNPSGEAWYSVTANDGIFLTKNMVGIETLHPQYDLDVNGTVNALHYLGTFNGTVNSTVQTANYSNLSSTANNLSSFPMNVVTNNYHGNLVLNGTAQATAYYGDGSNLTGIASSNTSSGGGSGIESIELKTALEKSGIFYPISTRTYLNEPYNDTSIISAQLSVNYTAGQTTINIKNIQPTQSIYLPTKLVIYSSANVEILYLNSLASGTTYNCTALANSYTIVSTNIVTKMPTIAGNQAIMSASYYGNASTKNYSIKRTIFPTTKTHASIDISSIWQDQELTINAFNSSNILVSTNIDQSSYLKSGDNFILYTKVPIDGTYCSPSDNILASGNFQIYTVSGNPTFASNILSITTNETINVTVTNNYGIVRYSVKPLCLLEDSATSNTLLYVTPNIFLPTYGGLINSFSDDFNRSESPPNSNNWSYTLEAMAGTGSFTLNGTALALYSYPAAGNSITASIKRNLENYSLNKMIVISFDAQMAGNGYGTRYWDVGVSDYALSAGNSHYVRVQASGSGAYTGTVSLYAYNVQVATYTYNTLSLTHYKFYIYQNYLKLEIYSSGTLVTTITYAIPITIPAYSVNTMYIRGYSVDGGSSSTLDNLINAFMINGYIEKATILNQSGNKLTIGHEITRQSAVSQNPVAYELNALVY
jgi:hypothetical protein